MILKDRNLLNEDGSIPIRLLVKCLDNHKNQLSRLSKLDQYYDGSHEILNRTFSSASLPNNKLVCNHAEYITDMATGYVFGVPISYTGTGSDELNELFTKIDEDSHNNELALDLSVFGLGYELMYMSTDEKPIVKMGVISPLNTFLVADTTIEHRPLFAVYYTEEKDIEDSVTGYKVNVYTETEIIYYRFTNLSSLTPTELNREQHYFGGVPVIEYQNNKKCHGDFEGVLTMIDAYNLLQSDRVNDKEQLVDALLAVIGVSFGDTEEEMTETARFLKEQKILELPAGGDAKWLIKNLNEAEIEILKKSLKDDIHEFSKVPCLTDENFVGNASGVAMKYKLFGMEQLGKTKERYFKRGLRQRIAMIGNINRIKAINTDMSQLDISMKRSLPVDDEMLARIAQATEGFISWESRVARFDPEIDIDEERKRLQTEKDENIKNQQALFGNQPNTPPEDGEVDEE